MVPRKLLLLVLIAPWLLLIPGGLPARFAAASGVHPADVFPTKTPTPTPEPQVRIASPLGGEALQGVVPIGGTTDLPGFRSAEVAFAYQADPTGTWFIIQQSSTPVKDGALAAWDTTTITDGEYKLRVQVFLAEGQVLESTVTGLRVRNYTPIETSTPARASPVPASGVATATPSATPLGDFQVKAVNATPLPTNPAQITPQHFEASALRGVLVIFGAALVGALYLGLRAIVRR